MLRQHYEKVLQQLREDAEKLADEQPDLAINFRRENTDPDVAKLLEGLALLAARQNIQLEQDQLEQQQGWLQAVAPNAVLPLPSMAIMRADTPTQVTDIPSMTAFNSTSSGEVVSWCNVGSQRHLPLNITNVNVEKLKFSITFECMGSIPELSNETLHIQLCGDLANSQQIAMSLNNHVRSIRSCVTPVDGNAKWLDTPKHDWNLNYQVVQGSWLNGVLHHKVHNELSWFEESMRFPQRGLSFDLALSSLTQSETLTKGDQIEIQWTLTSAMAVLPQKDDFCLHTVPLINLSETDLLPFNREAGTSVYELSFANPNIKASQFFGINRIYEQIGKDRVEYTSLASESWRSKNQGSFQLLRQNKAPYIQARLANKSSKEGLMRATARVHQEDLAIHLLTGSPVTGEWDGSLICAPSKWRQALNSQNAQWAVLKQQQANHAQTSCESLKELLSCLLLHENNVEELQSQFKVQIDALKGLKIEDDEVVRGTSVILGQHLHLTLNDNSFRTDAECWYFCAMIWQLFRSKLPINGALALTVNNSKSKELFYWPHATGTRALV